jgi:hypothetical protein
MENIGKYELNEILYKHQCKIFGNRVMSIPNTIPLKIINESINEALNIKFGFYHNTENLLSDIPINNIKTYIENNCSLHYDIKYDDENKLWSIEVLRKNIYIYKSIIPNIPFTIIDEKIIYPCDSLQDTSLESNFKNLSLDSTLKSLSLWLFKIEFNEEYNKYCIRIFCMYSRKCDIPIHVYFPNYLSLILSEKMYKLDLFKIRTPYLSILNGTSKEYNNHIIKYIFDDMVLREISTYISTDIDKELYKKYCYYTMYTRNIGHIHEDFDLKYQLGMDTLNYSNIS